MNKKIDKLIINSPFEEPQSHWEYNRGKQEFFLVNSRRPAGFVTASKDSKTFDDPGLFHEISLINNIRERVHDWRNKNYPGISGITQNLLNYWKDSEESEIRKFFYCQIEAIETLIWLTEAPETDKIGIDIPPDGGAFTRYCSKMATGTGKTVVMGMIVAWQILNKISNPMDSRFSKNILIVAPGLTVKSRLSVLHPSDSQNYYSAFRIVKSEDMDKLRQGRVIVHNWHVLNWETEEKLKKRRTVDKRGAKSDEAYVRDVLGEMAKSKNIVVINDEAHHAWRIPPGNSTRGIDKSEVEQATKWIGGLDRIHKARNIINCYDFSATPFIPTGGKSSEESLFGWVVSDFGLNDAIEAGLVKTPRVVIRDNAPVDPKTYKSKLYHIYNDTEVKTNLNSKAKANEPLPDLVSNAYLLLGYDWRETKKAWDKKKAKTPPVMITVANRTETAARIKYAFDHKKIFIDELCDSDRILHVDSKVLKKAEEPDQAIDIASSLFSNKSKLTEGQKGELLRKKVDTVGKVGEVGELIQNVISVGMLSEGWDAQTVTHIMGLRAFSSQLLCEQVVGRGLRRTSYDLNPKTGLLEPEYVNIFGIPFTFLPHEESSDSPPPPPPKFPIEPVREKQEFEISWPNIVRINHTYKPKLTLDLDNLELLTINAHENPMTAEVAPILDGKADESAKVKIELANDSRMQRIIFQTAAEIFTEVNPAWKGNPANLLGQVVGLTEKFLSSDKIKILPTSFEFDVQRKRLVLAQNLNKIVKHFFDSIKSDNVDIIEPILDTQNPIKYTGEMRTWYTGKPHNLAKKSHINACVYDSTWEESDAYSLDKSPFVYSWVKNDHLGFEIFYVYEGEVRKYLPDFIAQLVNGVKLVIETKGNETKQDKVKFKSLKEWVEAVNFHRGFGRWECAMTKAPGEIESILEKYGKK